VRGQSCARRLVVQHGQAIPFHGLMLAQPPVGDGGTDCAAATSCV
jgi:hypothetical protein